MSELQLSRWPDLVGLPYRDLGRDRSGVDCWGLVRLGLLELAGIEVPSYAGEYIDAGEMGEIDGLIRLARESSDWALTGAAAIRPLDVAVFRRGRYDAHLALVLDPARHLMLHASEGHGTRLDNWTSPLWVNRLAGFYRHHQLGGVK